MTEGYCIDDGREHYCSDECLHYHYSGEEFEQMYADGEGTSYYTIWGYLISQNLIYLLTNEYRALSP